MPSTLKDPALSVIDQFLHFKAGPASCSVPYINNKTAGLKMALRPYRGKGSPAEIAEEMEIYFKKNHIDKNSLTDESLKKLIVENGIGVDCSAFAYYVLEAENEARKKGDWKSKLTFGGRGIFGRITASFRPVENCSVAVLAENVNSRTILLKEVQAGDIITMIGGPEVNDRDHILVIHQIEYANSLPVKIYYSHAVAYPEDGVYGSGIRQGMIDIPNPNATILDGTWHEEGGTAETDRTYIRARKSKTELRRVRWW